MTVIPSDPLFGDQWYLHNTGQSGGTVGQDIRVLGAWPDYTGEGIRIAVIDDGVRYTHPDLSGTYDAENDHNIVTGEGDATPIADAYSHGTQVSGFSAAAANGTGLVGVAYGATFTGIRISDADGELVNAAPAFHLASDADVTNNSYGNEIFYEEPGSLDAIADTATTGRAGLGTVHVFASGNSRIQGTLSTHGPEQNSPYQITVAATDADGQIATFSSPGANVLVAAPGAGVLGVSGEDDGYDLTDGTSFSAPIVSGVAALVLQANPTLGMRDVQEILAYSAYDTGADPLTRAEILADTVGSEAALAELDEPVRAAYEAGISLALSYPWTTVENGATDWNGGGLTASHDYGFGQVDARAATRLAETWDATPNTVTNQAVVTVTSTTAVAVPDGDAAGVSQSLTVDAAMDVEFATVDVDIPHGDLGQLRIELTSPHGTTSYLIYNPDFEAYEILARQDGLLDELPDLTFFGANVTTLMSSQHYGESAAGDWTLRVTDTETGTVGTLESWSLTLYGDATTADDRYVYTDQYATLATADAGRSVLVDSDGGTDTINAAAVSGPVAIHLDGTVGAIYGAAFRVADGTEIENLYTGDGDDLLAGSALANVLVAGRGSDSLTGGAGDDILDGGSGLDTARFSGLSSSYAIGVSDSETVVDGADGRDILRNTEILAFDDGNRLSTAPVSVSEIGFDADFYLATNDDVVAAGFDSGNAYLHYLQFGGFEDRAPNALFDSGDYLAVNADVAAAGMNPLLHYHLYGHLEGRDAGAQFDGEAYLAANPDVAGAGIDPMLHYLTVGFGEGRLFQSDPLFG
ncbi:S8 family serine peptidase [Thalassobaculum litoreum]|uniref:Regulatory P domain of the subtilisin-like proprotein convertase n=1 Tax=Thalassobaculum litoreum DSM 18839 TaxID=1123362 RepID=A0A8G2BJT8_9PROT|nr:S8 family serine peptidase [Thalassobaculum litoreum]SDG10717.1 Regulatory P domain of the subtilisin-like proprotein convertase [Thalassobaculum litoreum DSM 18839]